MRKRAFTRAMDKLIEAEAQAKASSSVGESAAAVTAATVERLSPNYSTVKPTREESPIYATIEERHSSSSSSNSNEEEEEEEMREQETQF